MIFHQLISAWRRRRLHVILDPADNSVTLSRRLFRHIRMAVGDAAPRVFMCRIPDLRTFGFVINPDLDRPTQLCDIQYNHLHRCVGFETLCPSVGTIFYHLGLHPMRTVRFRVRTHTLPDGHTCYILIPPRSCRRS